jgi:hypothetical protein
MELEVHYRAHNSPPPDHTLRHMKPAHTCTTYFFMFHFNIILLRYPSEPFSPRSPTKILYTFLISSTRATCSAHFTFLYLITLITFCEKYKLWSSFCNATMNQKQVSNAKSQNNLLFRYRWFICMLFTSFNFPVLQQSITLLLLITGAWEGPEPFRKRWWRGKFPTTAGNRTLEPRSSSP